MAKVLLRFWPLCILLPNIEEPLKKRLRQRAFLGSSKERLGVRLCEHRPNIANPLKTTVHRDCRLGFTQNRLARFIQRPNIE